MAHCTQYHSFLRNDVEYNAEEGLFMHPLLDYGLYYFTGPDEENEKYKRIENEG